MTINKFAVFALTIVDSFALDCNFDVRPINFFPSTSICLFEKESLDLALMSDVLPVIKNFNDDAHLWVYRSRLNPEIFVTTNGKRIELSNTCEYNAKCSKQSATFSDVLKDEFQRFQQFSVYKGSAKQADSLINHIVAVMNNVFEKNHTEFDLNGLEYNISCSDKDEATAIAGPEFGLSFGKPTIVDSMFLCKDFSLDVSQNLRQIKYTVRKTENQYYINEIPYGTIFYIIDLNGKIIKKDLWKGYVFAKTKAPLILRFGKINVILQ